jgi:hypothetical protein
MEQLDQSQFIQKIADCILPFVKPGWKELVISCHIDEEQSNYMISYLIEEGGRIVEAPVQFPGELDRIMRGLQEHLSQGGKQRFTSCRMHFEQSGKFNADYGYGVVDWNALVLQKSNFFASVSGIRI